MAKRAKKLKACHKRGSSEARITELPDEIIVYILSLLTMKESGRTSVLSKRWRYFWAYIPVLNFDASKTLVQLMLDEKQLDVEKTWYLSWVDQVVSSYRGLAIDEFTVRFDVDESNEHNIDKWVKFVMEKRVKRLQFDFSDSLGLSQQKCYTFSCLSFCNSLTSLQLLSVNVTGDVLENFLNNCPQIEFVKVHGSESLVNLNVPGASVNLKYLEIMLCFKVKEIEIYAPNLVSFKYFGPKISVPFKNTLKIVELFIGGGYARHLSKNFSELSSYLSQLEVLKLDVTFSNEFCTKHIQGFPLCTMLKQLELIVDPDDEGNLFGLRSLINACPFLHKFILQLEWCDPNLRRKRIKRKKACPHYHLKIVEIVGFVGHAIDLEFIMYLMKSCVALEKIVIDPRSPIDLGTPWEFENEKRIRTARVQAEKLRAKLKPLVDLIII